MAASTPPSLLWSDDAALNAGALHAEGLSVEEIVGALSRFLGIGRKVERHVEASGIVRKCSACHAELGQLGTG